MMPDPITTLAALGYVISKHKGAGEIANTLSQLFGGAAGNAFHGDLVQLRKDFLTITRPDSNQDLDRAVARSSLHASLFCIMEALGEDLEPASGKLELWRQCVEERFPQRVRELGRPQGGVIAQAERAQLLQAKADCIAALKQIEKSFTPVSISPNTMLTTVDDRFAEKPATEALAGIEEKCGRLPDRAREIFREMWFSYLCGSFQHEIKQNQPVSNILSNISLAVITGEIAVLKETVIEGFDETLRAIRRTERTTRAPLDRFCGVPPLHANFINRPEISRRVRRKLLSTSRAMSPVALEGMSGGGKTMVARGVCYDPQVRAAFPDGIVWLTIGKESNDTLEQRVKLVANALNQEFSAYSAESYRTLLSNKAVLLVLDDVWSLAAVEPFLLPPGRSRLLYTSTCLDLAGPLGAESVPVGILEKEPARKFLARWSGRKQSSLPEPYASKILKKLNGHALGLSMVGAALRDQPDEQWDFVADDLRKANLKKIGRRVLGNEPQIQTLHAAIEVSVNALSQDQRDHYLQLAVLLDGMPAPTAVLQALWGGDKRSVYEIASLLVSRSLASRDANGDIRLHDLQLDYIWSEHPEQKALELQHAALLRSLHVVQPHPEQFTSQMIGRLLAYQSQPGIARFLKVLNESALRPRITPMWGALEAAGSGARRVLEGHSSWVRAVAVTHDGHQAVSGSEDKTLRLWDLEGSKLPFVLEGHLNAVRTLAVTRDGRHAVSGSEDNTLRVWDLESNRPPRVLEGHSGAVYAVAVTDDGRIAVSGSDDKTLRVWDLKGNKLPRVLEGHSGAVYAVAVTPDGRIAVSGSRDNTLRVWQLEGDQPPLVLEDRSNRVWAVAVTPDGRHAVSGSGDNTLWVWDLTGNRPPLILEGHSGLVLAVAVTFDGRYAVSGSEDNTLRVWDLEGNRPTRVLEGHSDSVYAVAVTPDGRSAVSGSGDNTLRVWDLEGNRLLRVLEGHSDWIYAVAVTPDGRSAVSGSYDGTLRIWDLTGNRPARSGRALG